MASNSEELAQREPLMSDSTQKSNNSNNSDIPYADENSPDDDTASPSRKASLSSRRNVELSLLIQNEKENSSNNITTTDSGNTSPKTATDESIAIETPPLPLPRSLRRNSISMPSGINAIEELESLRLKHQMQEQEPVAEEDKSRTDSVSLNI